jgi:hypothetical protein
MCDARETIMAAKTPISPIKRSISQAEVSQFIDSPTEVFVDTETHQRILNHPSSNGENLEYVGACSR